MRDGCAGRRTGGVDQGATGAVAVTKAEVLLLVARGDEASLLRVADAKIPARDVRLVLVGGGRYHHDEITQLTGLPVAVSVPWDPYSARVIAGQAAARNGWTRRAFPPLPALASAVTFGDDDKGAGEGRSTVTTRAWTCGCPTGRGWRR